MKTTNCLRAEDRICMSLVHLNEYYKLIFPEYLTIDFVKVRENRVFVLLFLSDSCFLLVMVNQDRLKNLGIFMADPVMTPHG